MVIVQLASPRWHGEVDGSNDRRNPSHRSGDEILESRKGMLRPLYSRRIMLKMLWGSLLIWSVVSFLTNTVILSSFSFGRNRICPPQPLFGGGNIMEVGGIRRPRRNDASPNWAAHETNSVHVQSADDVNRYHARPMPMPDESEWLLNKPIYSGRTIPKYLHKVIITTTGGYPEFIPRILKMMNDNDVSKGIASNRNSNWTGSIEEAHLSWKEKNPSYDIRYYDLHDCRLYLRQHFHPLFLRAFDCIEAFAGKTNFFRYLVVYREGGFYSDWKQLCLRDGLLDWISNDDSDEQPRWDVPALGSTIWFSAWEAHMTDRTQNAFFGAMPQSPVLAETIRLALDNIQKRADLKPKADALYMTGVGVLHKGVLKMAKGLDGARFGFYHHYDDKKFRYRNETIIKHKCSKCGQGNDWSDGNDYFLKLKIGEYFCPDAPSLFLPDMGTDTVPPFSFGSDRLSPPQPNIHRLSPPRPNESRADLPRVACFFMVNTNTLSDAVAVRYSRWGKRCAYFVIVSNGVSGGEQLLDDNTALVDIHHAIEMELQTRARDVDANERFDNVSAVANYSTYTTFPLPQNEIKEYLSLKSFYSWMYMARKFSDRVDYIMKADPDTFMLMDNYLQYLYEYYSPEQQVYIGRVFKTGGNFNDPFITGLSVTLSRATAKLLLSRSTIQGVKPDYHECSAERFRRNGGADDHVLAHCLRSVGVYPAFTRDEYGRERFLHFSPAQHYGTDQEPRWHKKFSFTPYSRRKGCCSSKACAFHYVGIEKQNATLYWSNFTHAWHFKKAA